jgi:hemerythrin-like domain-containing protein
MKDDEASAASAEGESPSAEGQRVVARLFMVHELMRHELAELSRGLASFAEAGASADGDPARGASLRSQGMKFCRFVHEHHAIEDSVILPALRRTVAARVPDVAETLARIDADHREVVAYLNELAHALTALPGDPRARSAACEALARLSGQLLEHLRFEDEDLARALSHLAPRG